MLIRTARTPNYKVGAIRHPFAPKPRELVLFEVCDGKPVPIRPGIVRRSDGLQFLNLRQAADRFCVPKSHLMATWFATLTPILSTSDLLAAWDEIKKGGRHGLL